MLYGVIYFVSDGFILCYVDIFSLPVNIVMDVIWCGNKWFGVVGKVQSWQINDCNCCSWQLGCNNMEIMTKGYSLLCLMMGMLCLYAFLQKTTPCPTESGMVMLNVILAEFVQTFVSLWRNQYYCTVFPDQICAITRRLRENGMYKAKPAIKTLALSKKTTVCPQGVAVYNTVDLALDAAAGRSNRCMQVLILIWSWNNLNIDEFYKANEVSRTCLFWRTLHIYLNLYQFHEGESTTFIVIFVFVLSWPLNHEFDSQKKRRYIILNCRQNVLCI